jgi:hypothetical protein
MAAGDQLVLLFADTLIEDEDTYRFLEAAAADLGEPVTRLSQGETPWDVFKRKRFLGNSRIDPCSMYLKRVPLRRWIEDNCDPGSTIIHLGIDFTEAHRFDRAVPRWQPWKIMAPLIDARVDKPTMMRQAAERGLPEQRLYRLGMPHANCGGGCVKAGQGHFARLLDVMPERFAEWERNEREVAEHIGADVAMLSEVVDGVKRPLPLSVLRRRVESQGVIDFDDIGGCGCALE